MNLRVLFSFNQLDSFGNFLIKTFFKNILVRKKFKYIYNYINNIAKGSVPITHSYKYLPYLSLIFLNLLYLLEQLLIYRNFENIVQRVPMYSTPVPLASNINMVLLS